MKEKTIPTNSLLKTKLGAAILEAYGYTPGYSKAGRLISRSRGQLVLLGYYWFPGQAAWCFDPRLGSGDTSREENRPR